MEGTNFLRIFFSCLQSLNATILFGNTKSRNWHFERITSFYQLMSVSVFLLSLSPYVFSLSFSCSTAGQWIKRRSLDRDRKIIGKQWLKKKRLKCQESEAEKICSNLPPSEFSRPPFFPPLIWYDDDFLLTSSSVVLNESNCCLPLHKQMWII